MSRLIWQYPYLQQVAPTWLQNWRAPLRALAIPLHGIELDDEQHAALDESAPLCRDRLVPADLPGLRSLAQRLTPLVAAQPGGAFVRLGSGSPKDSPLFAARRGRCHSEATAIKLLQTSRRMREHLRHSREAGQSVHVFDAHGCRWRLGKSCGASCASGAGQGCRSWIVSTTADWTSW